MVEANYGSQKQLLDPDFGVPLQNELIFYVSNPDTLVREYENFGYYNNGELVIKREMREGNYQYWNGASHFVTKKYYFERVSYILKWALPIILIVIGLLLRKYKKGEKLKMEGLLPKFVVIGAQRAGTTWLYECLKAHPDVFLPDTKELHFFDHHFDKGESYYRRFSPLQLKRVMKAGERSHRTTIRNHKLLKDYKA